jgi:hypothetical protein
MSLEIQQLELWKEFSKLYQASFDALIVFIDNTQVETRVKILREQWQNHVVAFQYLRFANHEEIIDLIDLILPFTTVNTQFHDLSIELISNLPRQWLLDNLMSHIYVYLSNVDFDEFDYKGVLQLIINIDSELYKNFINETMNHPETKIRNIASETINVQ